VSDDEVPDTVVGALEDGYRPPADPREWNTIYAVTTGEGCPTCGTAIALLIGPSSMLDQAAVDFVEGYSTDISEGWTAGYDHPVYVYCDRPECSWHGVTEWEKVGPVLEQWIGREAPTWRERVRQGADG
jgi:hypothetical protein